MRTGRFLPLLAASLLLAAGSSAFASAVAHWDFDRIFSADKGEYGDTVGNNHKATAENKDSVSFYDGDVPFGKALKFSGNDGNQLNIPYLANMPRGSFTVMVWFNIESNGLHPFLTDWDKNEFSYFFGADMVRDKLLLTMDMRSAEIRTNPRNNSKSPAVVARQQPAKGEISLKEWHHAAFSWNKADPKHGTAKMYLDGEEVWSSDITVPNGTVPQGQPPVPNTVDLKINNGNKPRIGGRADGNKTMKGSLDELWIFNEALPAEKVKNMMKYNNTEGTGAMAKVLIKKEPVAVAVADPPKTPDVKPALPPTVTNNDVKPVTQVTADPVVINPTPTDPPKTDPPTTPVTPTIAANTNNHTATPPEDEDPVVMTTSPAAPPSRPVAAPPTATPAAIPARYSPARMAGIIMCFTLAAFLGGFIIWGVGARAKLKTVRA